MDTEHEETRPSCARCARPLCHFGITEGVPGFCPNVHRRERAAEAREALRDEEVRRVAREASRVEGAGYCEWPRVREVMEFAARLGIRRIGIAFYIGLKNPVIADTDPRCSQ